MSSKDEVMFQWVMVREDRDDIGCKQDWYLRNTGLKVKRESRHEQQKASI